MRLTTRHKYYGRSGVAGAIRIAAGELAEATKLCYHHGLPKKLCKLIESESRSLAELLPKVVNLPVLPEEKLIAKIEIAKRKEEENRAKASKESKKGRKVKGQPAKKATPQRGCKEGKKTKDH